MTEKKKPSVPRELGPAGRRLWRSVLEEFELGPDELAALREAGHVSDELERLREAVAAAPLTTVGSTGQVVAHPLLEQVRRHRELLGKLLERLALPAGDEDQGLTPAQRRAQRAAQQRWRDREAVKLAATGEHRRGPA